MKRKQCATLLALALALASRASMVCAKDFENYEGSGITRRSKVQVEYMWLDAVDARALRKQLTALGPRDLEGVARDAFTFWTVKWRFPEPGIAGLRGATCDYSIKVTLPRWRPIPGAPRSAESDALEARWRSFTTALALHELGHIKIIEEHFNAPCEAIRAAAEKGEITSTPQAHTVAKAALRRVRELDRDYDRITDHGATQGARFRP